MIRTDVHVEKLGVNGVDLAYVEQGIGETVVFVHGAAGDWRSWEGLRPFVAEKCRFVSFSRRYHYPNVWADDGRNYSVTQHVEDVAALIRALDAGKVHLAGNSYGGRVAGYVALKYPDLLRSVILGEPSIIAPASAEGKAALAAMQKDFAKSAAAAKAGDAKQSAILLYDAVIGEIGAFQQISPSRQQRWLDNANTMAPMHAGAGAIPVSCEQLGALKVPALVIRGENTRNNFRYGNQAALECLPRHTESAVIANAPHPWPLVNPEAGAKAILAFVAKH